MTYTVQYARFHGRYEENFETFEEAVEFIEEQEDAEAIFATKISDETGALWVSRDLLPTGSRWRKARKSAPDWPIRASRG